MGPINDVEIVQLVKIEVSKGGGVPRDPARVVQQYWTMDGEFVCEVDPYEESNNG